jgi:hypothetical protein
MEEQYMQSSIFALVTPGISGESAPPFDILKKSLFVTGYPFEVQGRRAGQNRLLHW